MKARIIITCALLSLISIYSKAASATDTPKLYISGFTINPGETKTLELRGATDFALGGFQVRIKLPEGLSFAKSKAKYANLYDYEDEGNEIYPGWMIFNREVLANDDPTTEIDDTGALTLLCAKWNGEGSYAQGTDYCYLTIYVKADETYDNTQTILMYNMKMSNQEGSISYPLNNLYVSTNGGENHEDDNVKRKVWIEPFQLEAGQSKTVQVQAKSDEAFAGIQANIELPSGLSLSPIDGTKYIEVTEPFSEWDYFDSNLRSTNRLRVISLTYSPEANSLAAGTYTLGTIQVTASEDASGNYTISFADGSFSTSSGKRNAMGNTESVVSVTTQTAVNEISVNSAQVSTSDGMIVVNGANNIQVYTTSGSLVSTSSVTSVEPGYYIVVANGVAHKVAVK